MQFRILRVEELPLGTRILHPGAQGTDVKELQELLAQNGFYFGKNDGRYGPLTEEAIRLLERTFRLTVDGIAGHQVITALKNPSRQIGRIIYTVKKGDTLKAISRKFSVNANAWESIPGRGNPGKRLYPGMRLLLHEKALFLWDESTTQTFSKTFSKITSPSKDGLSKSERQLRNNIKVTHLIRPSLLIEPNGDLICRDGESECERNAYRIIEAPPEVWKALLASQILQTKLGCQLRKLKPYHFGLDLRTAPLNTIVNWPKFMKSLCGINHRAIGFLILPLLPPQGLPRKKRPYTHEAPIYWLSLPLVAKFTELLIFAPLLDTENPLSYEKSAAKLPEALLQLGNRQLNHKSLLLVSPDCWDWNLDLHTGQAFPYSKAKMIRAVNPQAAKYSTADKLTTMHYVSHRQSHCLVYRDIQGFGELFALIKKTNLLGLVIRDFEVLGKAGIEIILNSWAVLPESKLPVT